MNSWYLLLFIVVLCVIATANQNKEEKSISLNQFLSNDASLQNEPIYNPIQQNEILHQVASMEGNIHENPQKITHIEPNIHDGLKPTKNKYLEDKTLFHFELKESYKNAVKESIPEIHEFMFLTVFPSLKTNIRTKGVELCEGKIISDDWYSKLLSDEMDSFFIKTVTFYTRGDKFHEGKKCLKFFWE